MRQIFTSQRLENVEGVAHMLNEAGIETKITDGRTWKGNSRREFSYNDKKQSSAPAPAVWVMKADDYKRARELLQQGGLLDGSKTSSYVPDTVQFKDKPLTPQAKVMRVKLVLLGLIAAATALLFMRTVFA
ncbi:MAG TPA: pathogenicity-like protein [Arenimonas sp.]|nr:pathogenicity-like protein [Arenimonas sp.]